MTSDEDTLLASEVLDDAAAEAASDNTDELSVSAVLPHPVMRMAATVIAVKIYDRLCLSNLCILNPFKSCSCCRNNPHAAPCPSKNFIRLHDNK